MPYIQVNCTSCGGEIQLDSDKESGFCLHCGTKVVLQEAVQKLELINAPKLDTLFKIAKRAFDDNNFDETIKYSNRVLELDVDNYDAILLKGYAKGMLSNNEKDFLVEVVIAAKRVLLESNAIETPPDLIDKRTLDILIQVRKIINFVVNNWFATDKEKFDYFETHNKSFGIYLNQLVHCVDICEYCISLIEQKPVFEKQLIEYYQLALRLLVDQCRCYDGRRPDKTSSTYILTTEEIRNEAHRRYDMFSQLLRKKKPDCEIPELNH